MAAGKFKLDKLQQKTLLLLSAILPLLPKREKNNNKIIDSVHSFFEREGAKEMHKRLLD